jgi:hypothetical protein
MAAVAIHHNVSPMTVMIAVATVADAVTTEVPVVIEVVTVVDAAEIVVAVVATGVDAVVTEADAAEIAVAVGATAVEIAVRGENDVTSKVTVDQVRIAQSDRNVQVEMTKAAEIVARGVQPVVMMVATVDKVRLADAKLSK